MTEGWFEAILAHLRGTFNGFDTLCASKVVNLWQPERRRTVETWRFVGSPLQGAETAGGWSNAAYLLSAEGSVRGHPHPLGLLDETVHANREDRLFQPCGAVVLNPLRPLHGLQGAEASQRAQEPQISPLVSFEAILGGLSWSWLCITTRRADPTPGADQGIFILEGRMKNKAVPVVMGTVKRIAKGDRVHTPNGIGTVVTIMQRNSRFFVEVNLGGVAVGTYAWEDVYPA